MQRQFFLITMTFVVLSALLCACQPITAESFQRRESTQEEELVFETIELREPAKPNYWQDKNPGLLIIASPEDIAKASQYITDEAITILNQMDFSQSFGLIAFHGWRPTVHYEFEIQSIARNNNQISIFAHPSRASGSEAVSSLYHLVKIHKEGNWAQIFTFHLYIDDKKTIAIPVSAYIASLADIIPGEQLQFETIELRQPETHEKIWTSLELGLLVIAIPDDIEVARQYVSDEATIALERLDFSHYFALIAFDGWKSEGYQGFQIQEIVRQDDQVLILVQTSQKPGQTSTSIVTSLYHLIKIPKNTTWNQTITFKLYFDQTQPNIAIVKQYVP